MANEALLALYALNTLSQSQKTEWETSRVSSNHGWYKDYRTSEKRQHVEVKGIHLWIHVRCMK